MISSEEVIVVGLVIVIFLMMGFSLYVFADAVRAMGGRGRRIR